MYSSDLSWKLCVTQPQSAHVHRLFSQTQSHVFQQIVNHLWVSLLSDIRTEIYFCIQVASKVDIDLDVWPERLEKRKWTDGHPRKQIYAHIIFLRWTHTKCISKLVWVLQLIVCAHLGTINRHKNEADESQAAVFCHVQAGSTNGHK